MDDRKLLSADDLAAMIARSSDMRRALTELAERGAQEWRRIANAEARNTGAYADSVTERLTGVAAGDDEGRLVGRVIADDYKASWIEFGTVNQPARPIGRRAAEHLANELGGTLGPVQRPGGK